MNLLIQRAEACDIATIRTLEEEAFGFTWDEPTFLKELDRPNGALLVGRLAGQTVAAAMLCWAGPEVQLNSIVLSPKVRGMGHSIPFLGGIMSACRAAGRHWMTLEVKWDNPPAHALYSRLGFVTTARRARYYRDGQDARLMWAGHLQCGYFGTLLDSFAGGIDLGACA